MRRRFILLKDTPELKRGAILVEDCDGGDQGFHIEDKKYCLFDDQDGTSYTRKTVLGSPNWFVEASPFYLTKEQVKKVTKILGINWPT